MLKKLLIIAVALIVPLLLLATPFAMAFIGTARPVDGAEVGTARLVVDGFANVYVVPLSEKEVALIDCGLDGDAKAIRAELKRRSLDDTAVKHIFVTHAHRDHLGACQAFSHATVTMMAAEKPLLEGHPAHHSPMQSLRSEEPSSLVVSEWLADGAVVSVGPHEVRAYLIPGHTDGSAAYLIDGALYVGDSQSATSSGGVKAAPWVFSMSVDENVRSMKALAARLRDDGRVPRIVAFGHTGPLDGRAWLDGTLGL